MRVTDRREIRFRELAREMEAKGRDKARDMVEGFRTRPATESDVAGARCDQSATHTFAGARDRCYLRRRRNRPDAGEGFAVFAQQERALRKASDAFDQV